MSLLETVIALAILVAGFTIFLRLFTFSLRNLSKGDARTKAVVIADRELARLQAIGQTGAFPTLLTENGRSLQVEDFQVDIEVFDRNLYTPSSSWEQPYIALGTPRHLDPTAVTAIVRVHGNSARVEQARIISRPRQRLRTSSPPLTMNGAVPNPLPARASVHFDAHLFAASGDELPVTFNFYVIPGTGSGTITDDHNGKGAIFVNERTDSSGNTVVTGGSCQVRARAEYYGEEIWGPTVTINLGS